eukprot:CAMPEP_0197187838 /NCGR_PEP_ID=MMETSP1423-20130617/16665_1 /TAXON_ID=476441 /ORGANISM="Pseudo-nitzschia heimii, Strain UNC1101" /LENGTH=322 /DNA_ID=CAMNT_0042639513 /DNA_START=151 /DNA_END=1116 /DNA_ORIENTATION=+
MLLLPFSLRHTLTSVVFCLITFKANLIDTVAIALDMSNVNYDLDRRSALTGNAIMLLSSVISQPSSNSLGAADIREKSADPSLDVVEDPETYSALSYAPPNNADNANTPLILVLHGAGKNDRDILQDLANPLGEHAGLIPALISSNMAPLNLLENFCVLAPYSFGKPSFYNDPRRKLLQFVDWAIQNQNSEILPLRFDPRRIILFGFSDGATVAVELLTTKRFAAGVICSYGYSGKALPSQALDRLYNIPIWVFHSRDDVIFDVQNSDKLVQQLENVNNIKLGSASIIKYSRYNNDPENLPSRVRGHSMGITASKSTELYDW